MAHQIKTPYSSAVSEFLPTKRRLRFPFTHHSRE
jgi:hypothetical protein